MSSPLLERGGSSTSRSDLDGSSTTTPKTPTHTNSYSPAATCWPPASHPPRPGTAQVVDYYRQHQAVENRFRVPPDFLRLRPIRQGTEQRVRGHVAVCHYAALIETLINHALTQADIRDPDLGDQHLTTARALCDLNRIRHQLTTNRRRIQVTTRRSPLQTRTLTAIGTDTRTWDNPTIT